LLQKGDLNNQPLLFTTFEKTESFNYFQKKCIYFKIVNNQAMCGVFYKKFHGVIAGQLIILATTS